MKRIFSVAVACCATMLSSFALGQDAPTLVPSPSVPGQHPARLALPAPSSQGPGQPSGVPATNVFPGPNSQQTAPALVTGPGNIGFGPSSVVGLGSTSNFNVASNRISSQFNRKIRQLMMQVRDADDSDTERKAVGELKKSLEEMFDEKIKLREKEIESLEKRLKDLQDKNDERKQKKDEIVDLKLRTLINEVKGFGF